MITGRRMWSPRGEREREFRLLSSLAGIAVVFIGFGALIVLSSAKDENPV